MQIDQRYLDVDFRAAKQYVMGDLGRNEERCASMASYEAAEPLIPQADWKPLAEHLQNTPGAGIENAITRIYNQSQEGSCVGNAATQQNETLQGKLFGKENVVQLSAISVYQQIGSSPNSGAMVDDAMDAMTSTGAVPLDNPANRARFGNVVMPHTGFYSKKPEGWKEVAKQFRANECLVIRSVEGLMTAGLRGHPIVVGRAGHSILYLRPVWNNNAWLWLYVNSWLRWGQAMAGHDHGFGFDSERLWRSSAGWAFAVRSIRTPDHLLNVGT
jgi:hypothetical protein